MTKVGTVLQILLGRHHVHGDRPLVILNEGVFEAGFTRIPVKPALTVGNPW